MRAFFNRISPDDILPLLVLIGMLAIINGQLTRPDAAAYRHARRAAAGAFAAYGVLSLIVLPIRSAGDLVMILARCCLAAGVVHGMGALLLGGLTATIGDPINAILDRCRAWRAAGVARRSERMRQQRVEQMQRREAQERLRRLPQEEEEKRQQAAAAELAERQRQERVADARSAVTQYYEAHAELLADSLPPLLFKSQLETRFPASLRPEQAWQVAQETMAEMLPLVSAAKERRLAEESELRKTDEKRTAEEQARQVEERRKSAISRLTHWYEQEKSAIENVLPEGQQRDIVIQELHGRYDQLVKEALQEMKP